MVKVNKEIEKLPCPFASGMIMYVENPKLPTKQNQNLPISTLFRSTSNKYKVTNLKVQYHLYHSKMKLLVVNLTIDTQNLYQDNYKMPIK